MPGTVVGQQGRVSRYSGAVRSIPEIEVLLPRLDHDPVVFDFAIDRAPVGASRPRC